MTKRCSNCKFFRGKQKHVIGECIASVPLENSFFSMEEASTPLLCRPNDSCSKFRDKEDKVET